ncbi:rhodanese-like domain-containing protein [Halorubrum sp. RMP-47]|uniref:Rhodanese-like domain-containing protein n=1 Tax=Halorubrum miltondacostae TaxID=3076378 RepID=A0ABD5M639_9EURY
MAETISADEFRDRIDARRRGERSFAVVDTRPEESFAGWRVADAVHYFYKPFHEFDVDDFERETGLSPDDSVVTLCAKGKASDDFAAELSAAGYADVTVVADGMRGWSAVYDRAEVPLPDRRDAAPPLDVVQVQRRAKGCLGYLVVGGREAGGADHIPAAGSDDDRVAVADSDGSDRVAVAVDVSRHGDEWVAAAAERGASITAVLDTHVHADHLSGGRALADDLGVPYYLPAAAAARDVASDFEPIERNETLDVGGVDLKMLATPGHTDDGASYLVGDAAVLTGDTLFTDSVGRTELQFSAGDDGGDAGDASDAGAAAAAGRLYDSLHGTLLAQPDDVVVCPGHFAVANDGTTGDVEPGTPVATTVGTARREIEVLSLDADEFVERITRTLPEKPPNYESVIAANRGGESPPDETAAIELELGPNRCAAGPDADSAANDD